MHRSLLIFGGNGFVGSAVARWALTQGVNVTCISRSGRPKTEEPWQKNVKYVKGDALEPGSYRSLLEATDAVVHSLGVLIDSRTPLNISNVYQGSYEQMNRDSALTLLGELNSRPKPFVYVSAERGMFFSPRYLSTKREVEDFLKKQTQVPYAVVRPGFMYRENTPLSAIACGIDVLNAPDSLLKGLGLGWVSETFVPARSLHVDKVGKVIALAAFKPQFHGKTLGVDEIDQTAAQFSSL